MCSDCNCGRHLCNLHVIKPDLSKASVYQKEYPKKKPYPNPKITEQYNQINVHNLGNDSTYLKDYSARGGDGLSRPKPEDLLKTGGPFQNLTSYSTLFPGYRGGNQYVKPTDSHRVGNFPMRSQSTYAKSFVGPSQKKDEKFKIHDNLKTGSNWFGATTYGSNFRQPNPEDYAKKYSVAQKR